MSRFMLKPDRIIVERRPDPAYDRLFPYYVELCATSQFRSKLKGEGGVAGHAVMYIKGACKDERASFPQLRRCHRAATELDDPEHGVGVSVGRWFRNINWVAVPGYKLFFQGDINPGETLTQEHFAATVRDAAHAIELLSDDRFVKLDANLRYFRDKYDAILAKHDELRDRLASVRGTPYRRVARLHYEYIKAQRAEVETMLNRLLVPESAAADRK